MGETVVVSFATADAEGAEVVAATLERAGWRVERDQVAPDSASPALVRFRGSQFAAVVALLTPKSRQTEACEKGWGDAATYALLHGAFEFVTLAIGGAPVPPPLQRLVCIERDRIEDGLDALKGALEEWNTLRDQRD